MNNEDAEGEALAGRNHGERDVSRVSACNITMAMEKIALRSVVPFGLGACRNASDRQETIAWCSDKQHGAAV